jgi:hypothetical protein
MWLACAVVDLIEGEGNLFIMTLDMFLKTEIRVPGFGAVQVSAASFAYSIYSANLDPERNEPIFVITLHAKYGGDDPSEYFDFPYLLMLCGFLLSVPQLSELSGATVDELLAKYDNVQLSDEKDDDDDDEEDDEEEDDDDDDDDEEELDQFPVTTAVVRSVLGSDLRLIVFDLEISYGFIKKQIMLSLPDENTD